MITTNQAELSIELLKTIVNRWSIIFNLTDYKDFDVTPEFVKNAWYNIQKMCIYAATAISLSSVYDKDIEKILLNIAKNNPKTLVITDEEITKAIEYIKNFGIDEDEDIISYN